MIPSARNTLPLFCLSLSAAALNAGSDPPPPEENPDAVAEVMAGERDTAKAAWWGFDPEDSTEAIQDALDSPASKVIISDMGEPWIVRPLFINRDDLEVLFEEGSHLLAKEGEFQSRGDSLLETRDQENIVLRGYGATIEMRKEDYQNPPYDEGQHRMSLIFRGCRNVKILGLTLIESGGDGIYLGPSVSGGRKACEDFVIRDVIADRHHRQGMSVISARNLLVENGVFSNTSGHGPEAGIDLEPNNADEYLDNIVIRNSTFENNVYGMHMYLQNLDESSHPVSVLWEGNTITGGNHGIHFNRMAADGPRGTVEYRDNLVEDTLRSGILLRRVGAGSVNLIFNGNTLRNVATSAPYSGGLPGAPIALHARGSPDRQGGIVFNDLILEDDRSDPPGLLVNGWHGYDDFDAWYDVTGNIIVDNPHGAIWDAPAEILDETFTLTMNGKPVNPSAAHDDPDPLVVFEDNFENNSLTDSDNVPDFWSYRLASTLTGNAGIFVEDGHLRITIEANNRNNRLMQYFSSQGHAAFDFLENPIVLEVHDIEFDHPAGSFYDQRIFPVGFTARATGSGNSLWTHDGYGAYLRINPGANGALGVWVIDDGNHIQLGSLAPPDGESLSDFRLALDETGFNLRTTYSGGSTDEWSGEHGLTGTWGEGHLNVQYFQTEGGDDTDHLSSVSFGRIAVMDPAGSAGPGSYEAWQEQHFTPEQADDEEIGGRLADPAGDGGPNAIKFFLGGDPWIPQRDLLPPAVVRTLEVDAVGNDYLTITFTHDPDLQVEYEVLASENLVDWEAAAIAHSFENNGDGTVTRTYRSPDPIRADTAAFLRLEVR